MTELSEDEARRLPRYSLLPAALIGRLAVHQNYQKQGLGPSLLVDALTRCLRSESAVYALLVEAKNDRAEHFYKKFGFKPFQSQPKHLFLSLSEARKAI